MEELNKKLADRDEAGKFINGHTVTDANKQALRESMTGKVGSEARHWKKGKYKNSKGYIMIYAGSREGANKSGYIAEHRLVAEEFIGRELLSSGVVHHINGIKQTILMTWGCISGSINKRNIRRLENEMPTGKQWFSANIRMRRGEMCLVG